MTALVAWAGLLGVISVLVVKFVVDPKAANRHADEPWDRS